MAEAFDFIVVGAGASGSVIASRLAHSLGRPRVLLLEAGGENKVSSVKQTEEERYQMAFAPDSSLNWHYKTVPQTQVAGQVVDYSRGKGLGGSTAINFCGWTVGSRDDFDEWADIAGHERFAWANVSKCLRRVERLHSEIPEETLRRYVNPREEDHSTSGAIDLAYGESWLAGLEDILVAAEQSGLPLNADVNNGDPIGMGMGSVCIYQGRRLTALTAYLASPPENLIVQTQSTVAKVVLESKKVIGVQLVDGTIIHASKEVILSGGALNTPQILMLSGIGPTQELQAHDIEQAVILETVGKNLQDHCFSVVGVVLRQDDGEKKQHVSAPNPMGWFGNDALTKSSEYISLPAAVRQHLQRPTVPAFEIATHVPPAFVGHAPLPETEFLGAMAIVMNPQSQGEVTLQSASPADAPILDPKFLSHPFDRRVLIEGMRQTMKILTAPVYADRIVKKYFPADNSEKAIWEHICKIIGSSWHMASTVKMGKSSADSCVDSEFRVFGVQSLRVADMSVIPFVPNCHTQSTAYIIGEIAADTLIGEYGLGDTAPSSRHSHAA